MNTAIIVAAGSGSRFGGDTPKQFLDLCGKPVIVHTLEKFNACPDINEIILVLNENWISRFQEISAKFPFSKLKQIVPGGDTRADSVANGISVVESKGEEIIAVHDGARPLVSIEEISNVVNAARASGAACLTIAVSDTIKRIEGDKIIETVDRQNLRRALTPQCFRADVLRRSFAAADLSEQATDECFLVEKIGYPITLVEGSQRNIKITAPEDLQLAEFWLAEI